MTHTKPSGIAAAAALAACLLAAVGVLAVPPVLAQGAQPAGAAAPATQPPATQPATREVDRPGPFDWLTTQPAWQATAGQQAGGPFARGAGAATLPKRPAPSGPFDWVTPTPPAKPVRWEGPPGSDQPEDGLPMRDNWPASLVRLEGAAPPAFTDEIRKLTADGHFDEALGVIQEVLDQPRDGYSPPPLAAFAGGPGFRYYRPLRVQAAEALAGLAPKGRARYVELYDPLARKLLETAVAAGDLDALARLAERYPLTPSAAAAGEKLDQAERKLHPPSTAPATGPAAATPPAKSWPGLGALGGGIAVMDDCDTLLAPRWQQPSRGDGPGGLSNGPLTSPQAGALLGLTNRYKVYYGGSSEPPALEFRDGQVTVKPSPLRASDYPSEGRPNWAGPVVLPGLILPIVAGGQVIVRTDEQVVAYDLLTGNQQWASSSLPTVRPIPGNGSILQYWQWWGPLIVDTGAYALSCDDERVYFVYDLLPQDPRYVRVGAGDPMKDAKDGESRLAAISIVHDGRLEWRIGRGIGGDRVVREGRFLSAPACRDGWLYSLALHEGSYHLLCLNAADGSLLWRSAIARAPKTYTPGMGPELRLAMGSPPAVAGGSTGLAAGQRVYVTTNAGVVAALSARTGRALWATQYNPRTNWATEGVTAFSGWTPRPYPPANPILVTAGRVICMPADANEVFALDANDGQMIWHVPRGEQHDLSAIDAGRVLLSGPSLRVLAAKDGRELAGETTNLGIAGRPAVTPSAVLASGPGRIIRLDLKTYKVFTLGPASGNALLGNLVAADGKLIAANVAGVAAYFSFERGFGELTARLAEAPAGMQADVLMERAQFAFDAGKFDAALANLLAYRKLLAERKDDPTVETQPQTQPKRQPDTEQGRYQEALRERQREEARERHRQQRQREHELFFHTYLGLGNQAGDPARMQAQYDQAAALADTPRRKVEMLLRQAKCRQRAGDFAAAADIAQGILEKHAEQQIADVDVGPDADDVGRLGTKATTLPAAKIARDYIAYLIELQGRDCYARFDKQAAEALAAARKDKDVPAMLAVAARWPNSLSADAAEFAAAETLYLRARTDQAHGGDLLAEAWPHLSRLAHQAHGEYRIAAGVGLAIVYAQGGWATTARIECQSLRRLPPQTPVQFADFRGTVAEAIRRIESRLPTTAPATPATRAARNSVY